MCNGFNGVLGNLPMLAEGAVLQQGSVSCSKGTKSTPGSKHLRVFFLSFFFFQSMSEIPLGNLPTEEPGYHLNFLSTTERLCGLQKGGAGQRQRSSQQLCCQDRAE